MHYQMQWDQRYWRYGFTDKLLWENPLWMDMALALSITRLKHRNVSPNPTHLPQIPTLNNARSKLEYRVKTSSSPAILLIIQFVICFGPACFEYSSGRKFDYGYQLEVCMESTDIHLVNLVGDP
ncbi:uncharacterized protein Bfra_004815 [Botrytis fragariae]|uniref:Uncharacterized protein n=1 Tax=Botrytis fragariae TaxID=1964551 RepID=A0A8H6ATI6_9HELO|nr:uncharacterized protein Bfra_004815 [Botrytis fragariae]KAF5873357.1 hypothetical protein Bfra_004815 [Botrytis fragariae]